ncbi:hypothetical protein ACJJTC_009798 [Scirpophaga incertulas]
MAANPSVPRYMSQLLEELGWDQGTRIPLANPDNQNLETLLLSRQNEIQQLKEALILQKQKCNDLNNYKKHVHTEYQENTRLLFAHKQQLEQEVKLRQLSCNEAERLERDIHDCGKQNKDIAKRIDKIQCNITRLLKKADSLKTEVCGERGALQDWRAALERNAGDITAIEQFTKQDISKAKALETKRQKMKLEHDQMHERLNQLVSNLSAEERACERIAVQVMEGMEQRKQMMDMWTSAVENLRQRDTDIRHLREDYAVLEVEAGKLVEQCREQQAFCEQQRGNNTDAERELMSMTQRLSGIRAAFQQLNGQNTILDSETHCLHRELSNMRQTLEKLHMENRHIMEEQHRKDSALQNISTKIQELKEKLVDSQDKSKSSEKRAKELEEMLNEEERYASQATLNQQRAMHCSFVEQQKLLTLKNEEKLYNMQLKASKAAMSKLDTKQREIEKSLQNLKENLYSICYQVETVGARVSHMEGAQAERECSAELVDKENRLKEVCARHAARVALLERHAARLHDDMRRLGRDLDAKGATHVNLQSRLRTAMLSVEGGERDVREAREACRRARVEEALVRVRAAHAARALALLGDAACSADARRLRLDAEMNERLVEIAARRDMFSVQKRALMEDCGKLRTEIREREQRIEQLKKRHDIFMGSLGKDESGQELSVTFFKIKLAAERAELRSRGAALDADVARRERDVRALEAALRVLHAAHKHFARLAAPVPAEGPEMEELDGLMKQYYEIRDQLKAQRAKVAELEPLVTDASSRLTLLTDKMKQLTGRQSEAENDLECAREKVSRQEIRLHNAHEVVSNNARRAKKIVDATDDWRTFQMSLWIRDYAEAAQNALQALAECCGGAQEHSRRFRALLSCANLQQLLPAHQRRLHSFISRIIADPVFPHKAGDISLEHERSVFSTSSESVRSGTSLASGYTKRLSDFRRSLAPKLQEKAMLDDVSEQGRRSTVSLRVVTLGLGESSTK